MRDISYTSFRPKPGATVAEIDVAIGKIDATTESMSDTVAMAEDPDGAGGLTSGFDPVFREPIKVPAVSGQGPGTTNRKEKPPVIIPAQIEPDQWEKLNMVTTGNEADTAFGVVLHFRWLEANDFVDVQGNAKINVNDRLVAIYDCKGNVVFTPREPMYVDNILPMSFGLGHSRNLLQVTFRSRDSGVPR